MTRRRRGGSPPSDGEPGLDRKQVQLAAQIARSVEQTLVGEFEDEVLQNLELQDVSPAPGSRMAVTLIVRPPGTELSREQVLERLEKARPTLMRELARDLSRRALPELAFQVVRSSDSPPAENGGGGGGDVLDEAGEDWQYDPFE